MTELMQVQQTVPYDDQSRTAIRKRKQYIREELKQLGLSWWGLHKSETNYLYHMIHTGESLGGVVYGHSGSELSSVMLVATDRRIILVDTKPLFAKSENISYDVVSGVTYEWVGVSGTIILHTRLGDISVRTMNRKSADIFHTYVEETYIEHQQKAQ